MIRQFFKEFGIWYLTYAILTISFLLTFMLFHLPVTYFRISFSISITITNFSLAFGSTFKFKKKQIILQQFIYVKELDDFNLPSEKAFKAIICKQKRSACQRCSSYSDTDGRYSESHQNVVSPNESSSISFIIDGTD